MTSLQPSPMNTIDVTLKTQNEIGGCLTEQINAVLFAMTCQVFSRGVIRYLLGYM